MELPIPKKRNLSRERIVGVGFVVLDDVGLDKLSLRTLAGHLGVQAPALYKHFKNKDALLIAMMQLMMDEWSVRCMALPEDEWRHWLRQSSIALRDILCSHRDGPRLFMAYHSYTTSAISPFILSLLSEQAGFVPFEALSTVSMIINFVLGFTLEEDFERYNAPITHQYIADNIPQQYIAEGQDYDKHFLYGLDRIIDGLLLQSERRNA